jgi:hypothetical protein
MTHSLKPSLRRRLNVKPPPLVAVERAPTCTASTVPAEANHRPLRQSTIKLPTWPARFGSPTWSCQTRARLVRVAREPRLVSTWITAGHARCDNPHGAGPGSSARRWGRRRGGSAHAGLGDNRRVEPLDEPGEAPSCDCATRTNPVGVYHGRHDLPALPEQRCTHSISAAIRVALHPAFSRTARYSASAPGDANTALPPQPELVSGHLRDRERF